MWDHLFYPDVSVLEKVIRPIIVYAFLVVGLRLAGKRELAQLNAFDLIVLLTISNTVQNAIIGNDNSVSGGLIGAATLLALNALVVRVVYNHKGLDRLIEGEPVALIENGRIIEERMKSELVTHEELEIAAHKQGFARLDQVERAVLEAGGVISFDGKQPALGEMRHRELTERMDRIGHELATLHQELRHRK